MPLIIEENEQVCPVCLEKLDARFFISLDGGDHLHRVVNRVEIHKYCKPLFRLDQQIEDMKAKLEEKEIKRFHLELKQLKAMKKKYK
jgi:hypothetical protein